MAKSPFVTPDGLRIESFDEEKFGPMDLVLGKQNLLIDWAINEPGCCAGFIEWEETKAPYPYCHNEVHYAITGSAEYTYTSYPFHMEEQTRLVNTGDICLIRYGTVAGIRPIERPYRTLYVVMPMPETPYQPFDDVTS
ncbi:MAG: hypothetical protein WD942_09920 [Dehalococcoidia bacterium]